MQDQSTLKINPEVLLFMRKSAGMTEEEIAKKLKLSKTKYLNLERGEDRISQNDLIRLADIYKRPLIAFQAVDTSQTTELPLDYRLNRDKKISSEVFLAKRKALYLAEELREITGKQTSLPDINTNVLAPQLAENILSLLQIDYDIINEIVETKPKDETILAYYKSLIEEKFFIPVIEHPLKSSGVRAFSVYGNVSVMVLNESDPNEVRLFSLFHEFCHLLKRQDGICTVDIERDKNIQPEENFCDEFAANILMPEQMVRKKYQTITNMRQLDAFAKQFGVSKLVTLIRLKELNMFSLNQYAKLKKELVSVNKKAFGRRNWEQTYIKRTSRLVLNNLINAYKQGDLTYASLSTITGIKDKYLQKYI